MRPMDETAQIVPLVSTTHVHPVTHSQWYAFREIDIVRDE